MKHIHHIKVRGFHTDLFGHVNNARYLEFLEESRWECLEDTINFNKWREMGRTFAVVNININYRHPACLGDHLVIHTEIAKLGKKSGIVHQDIFLKDANIKIADANITFVIIDVKTNKAIRIEGEIFEALHSL